MKLKPCPSCGGDDIRCEDKDTKSFYCYECDLQSRKCETIEEAIEAWNRRDPIDRIVERLEAEEYDVNCNICDYDSEIDTNTLQYYGGKEDGIRSAIEIVKGGAV